MKNKNFYIGSKSDKKYVNDNYKSKMNDGNVKDLWFIRDVKKLYKMMLDPNVSWAMKSLIVGALAYFVCPLDAVPDFIPVAGFLDDAGVIAATIAYLKGKIDDYD